MNKSGTKNARLLLEAPPTAVHNFLCQRNCDFGAKTKYPLPENFLYVIFAHLDFVFQKTVFRFLKIRTKTTVKPRQFVKINRKSQKKI